MCDVVLEDGRDIFLPSIRWSGDWLRLESSLLENNPDYS